MHPHNQGKKVCGSLEVVGIQVADVPQTYPAPKEHELTEVLSAQLEPCKIVGFRAADQSMLLMAYL